MGDGRRRNRPRRARGSAARDAHGGSLRRAAGHAEHRQRWANPLGESNPGSTNGERVGGNRRQMYRVPVHHARRGSRWREAAPPVAAGLRGLPPLATACRTARLILRGLRSWGWAWQSRGRGFDPITSSTRASTAVRPQPSAFAVFNLITSWNFVGWSTGRGALGAIQELVRKYARLIDRVNRCRLSTDDSPRHSTGSDTSSVARETGMDPCVPEPDAWRRDPDWPVTVRVLSGNQPQRAPTRHKVGEAESPHYHGVGPRTLGGVAPGSDLLSRGSGVDSLQARHHVPTRR